MRTDVVTCESLPSAPPSVRAEVCENGRVRVECAPPVDDGGLDILQYEVEVPLRRRCTAPHRAPIPLSERYA
jgi:hypothetical protein